MLVFIRAYILIYILIPVCTPLTPHRVDVQTALKGRVDALYLGCCWCLRVMHYFKRQLVPCSHDLCLLRAALAVGRINIQPRQCLFRTDYQSAATRRSSRGQHAACMGVQRGVIMGGSLQGLHPLNLFRNIEGALREPRHDFLDRLQPAQFASECTSMMSCSACQS